MNVMHENNEMNETNECVEEETRAQDRYLIIIKKTFRSKTMHDKNDYEYAILIGDEIIRVERERVEMERVKPHFEAHVSAIVKATGRRRGPGEPLRRHRVPGVFETLHAAGFLGRLLNVQIRV